MMNIDLHTGSLTEAGLFGIVVAILGASLLFVFACIQFGIIPVLIGAVVLYVLSVLMGRTHRGSY